MAYRHICSLVCAAVSFTWSASSVSADPVQFMYHQSDAATGVGTFGAYSNGIFFGGGMQTATVVQNDAGAVTVPSTAIGFVNSGSDANPGANNGVHLGWSGTTTLTGQIRDDLDPNTVTSNSNQYNVYQVDVSYDAVTGAPHFYAVNYSDEGGSTDVTNGLTHRAWIGDNGSGHRHTGDNNTYGAGAETFVSTSEFNLGGNAAGDQLGFTAGVGATAPNGPLFVEDIVFGGQLQTVGPMTFVESFTVSAADVITGVNVSGTGLAPEGAMVVNGGFAEDALSFTDRTHEYTQGSGDPTIAALGLDGLDYVQLANDDKNVTDFSATVDFAPGSKDVFLTIDDRLDATEIASILNGNLFVDTGVDVGIDENGDGSLDQDMSLYLLPNFTGSSLTFGALGQGSANNYGVIARLNAAAAPVPEPTSVAAWMLMVAGLALLRRYR